MRSFPLRVLASSATHWAWIALVVLISFAGPGFVHGAGLSFTPSSGVTESGSNLQVSVAVDAAGGVLNAVSGVISFSKDQLEVVSIGKNQSIVSLWVQEPSFSNSEGTIRFEGVVLNPGYAGSAGKVIEVTFRARTAGEAKLTFSAGSVLANDGEGSEILTRRGEARFTITDQVAKQDAVTEADPDTVDLPIPALLPQVVTVSSTPTGWLRERTGTFNFTLPEGVVALRLLLDQRPDSQPTVLYQPPIASRTIDDLESGISFLHVQYKNADGWGEVLHHEIKVDTEPPRTPTIKPIRQDTFLLSSEDSLSGIERYEVVVNSEEPFSLTGEAVTAFVIPETLGLSQGQHMLTVRSFDQAGNSAETSMMFEYVPPMATGEQAVAPLPMQSSQESPVYSLLVPQGAILITVLSVIIPLVALIVLLGILVYVGWRTLGGLRRRIDREVKEASEITRRAFFTLRTDLEIDIETLKKANLKRKLTREESKILKRLQANINTAEQVIGKEITDIEKEIT